MTHELTHKGERAPVLIRDSGEVGGAVIPDEVDVLVHCEGVELVVEQVVVMPVEDDAEEVAVASELEELRWV